jgi:hypothetical protein
MKKESEVLNSQREDMPPSFIHLYLVRQNTISSYRESSYFNNLVTTMPRS